MPRSAFCRRNRYLVEEKGFTTFSLETGWSGGVRLNEYVWHGTGDLDQIMEEEFQGSYRFWRTIEYRDLIEWMRDYNSRHAAQVQFMGNDLGYVGPELIDPVTRYVRRHHPTLPAGPGRAGGDAWHHQRVHLDRPARPCHHPGRHVVRVRLGRPTKIPDAMLYRDRVMADNTAWWHEQTGAKVLLSAHNGHIGYESHEPEQYPRMQGAFLRDRLGADYVSVGFTFHHGSFNAQNENDELGTFAVGPAGAGNNEYILDRVAPRDYLLDMRSAPAVARTWLGQPRPTHSIGTGWPQPDRLIALGTTHDILIHLHRVRAAHLLG